jgi:hypothetical protein
MQRISEEDKKEFENIVAFWFHKCLRYREELICDKMWKLISEMPDHIYSELIHDACKEGFDNLEKTALGVEDYSRCPVCDSIKNTKDKLCSNCQKQKDYYGGEKY